jgi:hypothetical protein
VVDSLIDGEGCTRLVIGQTVLAEIDLAAHKVVHVEKGKYFGKKLPPLDDPVPAVHGRVAAEIGL